MKEMKAIFSIEDYGDTRESLEQKGEVSGIFQRALNGSVTLPDSKTHYVLVQKHHDAGNPTEFSIAANADVIDVIKERVKSAGFDLKDTCRTSDTNTNITRYTAKYNG